MDFIDRLLVVTISCCLAMQIHIVKRKVDKLEAEQKKCKSGHLNC